MLIKQLITDKGIFVIIKALGVSGHLVIASAMMINSVKERVFRGKNTRVFFGFIQKKLYWRALKIYYKKPFFFKFGAGLVAFVIFATVFSPIQNDSSSSKYDISKIQESLLTRPINLYARKLAYDQKLEKYIYNAGYTPSSDVGGDSYSPKIGAEFFANDKKSVVFTDPVNEVSLTFTPKFKVDQPQTKDNFVIYPISNKNASTVFTLKASGVKEDIVLFKYDKDKLEFKYDVGVPDGLEMRLENDGSIGVYGVSQILLGKISTGTEADVKLLENARKNGDKNNLIFRIPAPFIVESGKKTSTANAWFSVNGKELTIHASNLKSANYPLSIDPSVYIESARKLMKGNNESNIDFDVDNELIQKGSTTGARIDTWNTTSDMNTSVFDQATAAAGGFVYRAGGKNGRIMPRIVGKQTSTLSTDNTNFTMSMPSVRPAGDLYVALLCHDGIVTVTPPSGGGWTEYADTREHAAYYKIGTDQGGGNEAASYTWVGSGSEAWAGVILRIKDFNSSDIESGIPATGSSGVDAIPVYPAVTPDTQGALVLRASGFDDDSPPSTRGWSPASHTGVESGNSGGANDCGFTVDQLDSPVLTTTSTGTATLSSDAGVSATYGASTVAINGNTASTTTSAKVDWAQFNSTSRALESPNPGAGACTGWCNNSVYDLSEARIGMPLVAYNGFLYAMGGSDGTNRESTVWIAKISANGEPQLWHPTDTNKNNWVYWYSDTGLNGATARSYHAAVAYNNRMYVLGGQTNVAAGGVTTVEMADILPDGRLGSWTTSGLQVLPDVRHSQSVHIYNDVMYLIGGNSNGTLRNTVYYSKLNTDGTMNSWTSATSFTTARASSGGIMSGVWGGYLYIAGGCTAYTSGFCSSIASDVQLASINSDGTIAEWNTILFLQNQRFGSTFIPWRNALFRFGGCSRQDTTTGDCYATHKGVEYGVINSGGDASTVSNSEPSGTAPCSGATPTNCDLPPAGKNAGQAGLMNSIVVINNGFIYSIGGCTDVSTTQECDAVDEMSSNVIYSQITSTGQLTSPPTCVGSFYGHWCVDNTNTINPGNGVGTSGATVFNNTIYVVGGADGNLWLTNVYRVGLNTNGSLSGAWTAQTFTALDLDMDTGTAGMQGVGYSFVFSRANPSSASTYPGNLYVLGGCQGPTNDNADNGIQCETHYTAVYKCNIMTTGALEEADANDCTKTGQLQIDADNVNSGSQGLGAIAGAMYANYIYLVGGRCDVVGTDANAPCGSTYGPARRDTIYAKIDNNNNIVDADGETAIDDVWSYTTAQLNPVRERGASFAYNGYLYSLAGYNPTGTLRDLLFGKINVSTGDVATFSSSTVQVTQRWDLRAIVSNGYVYTIGGCATGAAPNGCTALQREVQTFQLYNNDSGGPVSFTALSDDTFAASTDRIGASSVVLNGYIYVAGGCTNIACGAGQLTSDVQYAPISSADGTVGTWASASNVLPAARAWGQLEVAGGSLYYIGGQDDTADEKSDVYYAGTFSSGNISAAWSTATGGIGDTALQVAQDRTRFGATVWNNRIYVVGGLDDGAANTNTVYISPQLNSGGNISADSWQSDTDTLNVSRRGNILVAYANNLYSFGGNNGTQYLNDAQVATIGYKTGTISQSGTTVTGSGTSWTSSQVGSVLQYPDGSKATITAFSSATSITVNQSKTVTAGTTYVIEDGSVGAWSYTTSMPTPLSEGEGFAYNGYMYLIGGRSAASTCAPDTIVAPISANTTIATSNNPTGIGEWYETNQKYTTDRYGSAVSYANGKLFILGGGCSSLVSVGRHFYTTLKAQPQIARYSRMIDTDTDVFPTKWLMNGLDNSIGARWNMRYRSMHDLDTLVNPSEDCGDSATMAQMTTWGQETNFGEVTLGNPETYTPKNSSGANINCARYFYFSVNIDSSRAFGYPEDVARGPTIADLTLFFTSDPTKRLKHGKTFTGGEKQPLDTPF